MLPDSLQKFIQIFSKLPGLGPRASTRLVFYLTNLDRPTLDTLIDSLSGLKKINRCKKCFFIKETSQTLCSICSDIAREKNTIAIIEKETDLLTLEKSAFFHGTYFVLGELNERGILEASQKMRLQYLKNRIREEFDNKIKEIIVAVNPNALADILYEIILDEFKNVAEKITRLGRGIPTGGEIEFADPETLKNSLDRRN